MESLAFRNDEPKLLATSVAANREAKWDGRSRSKGKGEEISHSGSGDNCLASCSLRFYTE